jgi:hypothetical protein
LETEEETANYGLQISELMDVYFEDLSRLLQNPLWTKDFAAEMESGECKPLDFAVMCQGSLATIQQLCSTDSKQLTENTIRIACKHGAKPGVVAFLVQQKPELVRCKWGNDLKVAYPLSLAMSQGPGEARPTENDIKTLIKLWPQSVVVDMYWSWNGNQPRDSTDWGSPLQQCLFRGYSEELLDFMIDHIPSSIQEYDITPFVQIREKDLKWLSHVLPRIENTLESQYAIWDAPAFLGFLELLSVNKSIKKLVLYLEIEDNPSGKQFWSLLEKFTMQQSFPMIEELDISFESQHPMYLSILRSLSSWPRLRKLHVCLGDGPGFLRRSMPAMCNLFYHGQLEDFVLQTGEAYTKEVRHFGEVCMPLKPLIDAVKINQSLRRFQVVRGWKASDNEEAFRTTYGNFLVETLQVNTTLQSSEGWGVADGEVAFHTKWNKCGRMRARNVTTTLEELVELLGSVEERLVEKHDHRKKDYGQYATSIHYALLQDSISKWVGLVCS